MKGFREIALVAVLALTAGCSDEDKKKNEVPAGQISAKMINNPRTAAGNGPGYLQQFPELSFVDSAHHFGTISAGEVVEHDFPFSNTGKSPLLIVGATSTCGCTAPQYPTNPIAPGEKGVIKVRFDSKGKQGHVLKAVTINTNGNPGTRYLTITADVNP
jgi:hypothetical protein